MAQLAAKRYAKALFELALEKNMLDEFDSCAKTLLRAIIENVDFYTILKHPHIEREEKMSLIKTVFHNELPEEFLGLLSLIFVKKREEELSGILENFNMLAMDYKNIIEIEVTSAVVLTDKQLSDVRTILSKKLNKQVVVMTKVDKSIVAGLKIKAGGKLYDATVETQLNELKSQLLNTQLA